ncbi:hypothetical protein SHELI_v1c04390 [Spiroplasma helicoides]|uniref:PD-(D/E)XK motif protein n=1 Tax=Spiroplasma helicoides TaxID=216938 RepID=A0A1B3SKE4_9MOLU|nr:hypothetical protein [Spiroplasma helicoides]AOG60390.1 hypothetical protein SHELI_v1c04390 [Spiroplasma helicoides]
MVEIILENKNSGTILQRELKDKEVLMYNIIRKTSNKVGKMDNYSKFYYLSAFESDSKVYETIIFKEYSIVEEEAILIYNFINNLFEEGKVSNLKESIKYVQNTFGRVLGFTREKVAGKMGELLFILQLEKQNIEIAKYFNNNEGDLFDFYIYNNNKYLEIKTSVKETKTVTLNVKQLTYKPNETSFGVVMLKEDQNGTKLIEVVNELLDLKEWDPDFKEYLENLKINIDHDMFCEDLKYDIENALYELYLPNKIQEKIPFLDEISKEEIWNNVESIKLKINLSGIEKNNIEEVKNFLEI